MDRKTVSLVRHIRHEGDWEGDAVRLSGALFRVIKPHGVNTLLAGEGKRYDIALEIGRTPVSCGERQPEGRSGDRVDHGAMKELLPGGNPDDLFRIGHAGGPGLDGYSGEIAGHRDIIHFCV